MMANRKFELVADQSVEWMGRKLFRIRALAPIERYSVRAGDLGGYIEHARNLSDFGDAWVSGDAWVYGNARVSSGLIALATRSDGHGFAVYPTEGGGIAITAGCRFFTSFEEARHHWRHRAGTTLGAETDAILGYLEAVAVARGFMPKREGA